MMLNLPTRHFTHLFAVLSCFVAVITGCAHLRTENQQAPSNATTQPDSPAESVQSLKVTYQLDQERYEFKFSRSGNGFEGRSQHDEILLGRSNISTKSFENFYAHLKEWVETQRLPASSLPDCHQPVHIEIDETSEPKIKSKTNRWFGCRTGAASKPFSRLMREAEFLIHSKD